MNTQQILQAQFNTFVTMARVLKDANVPTWSVYVYKAEAVLKQIKANETREFDMNNYLKLVAA